MRLFPNKQNAKLIRNENFFVKSKSFFKILFFIALSLSITFNNFAEDDDTDLLEKVLEDKPKKQEPKKVTSPTQVAVNSKDKKKKVQAKTAKKTTKPVTKVDPNKKPTKPLTTDPAKPIAPPQNLATNKLNLEYWIHEELAMNSNSIPGYEDPKLENTTNPNNLTNVKTIEKPIEKKPVEKVIEKDSKPSVILTFLNEYKKIIFIFTAIIIFAIYRLGYSGGRSYNNSGRIFSKFRNK